MLRILGPFIVAATLCWSSNASAAPGDLDTSFGTGGKVFTDIGSGNNSAYGVALQADNKIVTAGFCWNGSSTSFCLARYLPNGAVDTSFNTTGKVIAVFGSSYDNARALALQADGKMVVAGDCTSGSSLDLCVVRFLPNGAIDRGFGTNGKVTTVTGPYDDIARSLAVQPDGNIVVAGSCDWNASSYFCVARYRPTGELDTSFNATGIVSTRLGSRGGDVGALALQPDGKIVVAGSCLNDSDYDFCVARYLPSGTLDSSFSTTGTVTTDFASASALAYAVALQPDGKIVVAGSCTDRSNNNIDFCLARYLPNGTLDTTFNATGQLISNFARGNRIRFAVALQPDGKIVATGVCNNGSDYDFCVARYLPSGTLDSGFSTNGIAITSMGTGHDRANALTVQPDGRILVAGTCFNGINDDYCLARYEGGPNTPKTLTEYVYTPLNYYFLTSRDTEKAILDGTAGWSRTGQSFSSLTFADPASRGINRYYFDQIAKNQTRGSHFYTLVDSEKTALAGQNPNNQPSPRLPYYEGIDSYAFLPVIEGVGGSCAAGQVPVYRAFRGQASFPDDPNHRFTTSLTLYNQLVAQGWDGEGVKLCAPN